MNTARDVYKTDQPLDELGTRPAYREGQRFGSNVALKALGLRRASRRNVLRKLMRTWHARHLRCQFTLSNPYFALPPEKLCEIIDHILEEGGTVLLTIFNFTAPALDALPAERVQKLFAHPWVQARKDEDRPLYAGKLALSLGWSCADTAMLKWCMEYIERQLAPLHKYKGNPRVMFELRNEIDTWPPTAVYGNVSEPQPYDLETFCRALAMEPSPEYAPESVETLEQLIAGAGYTLYNKVPVHGYYGVGANRDGSKRTSQWFLGYTQDIEPLKWDAQEFNAHKDITTQVPGTTRIREALRCGLDLAARKCDVMYFHAHMLCAPAIPYADTDPFGQFRDVATALSWAGGKIPEHEGACTCDPYMGEAMRQFAWVVTLGGEA